MSSQLFTKAHDAAVSSRSLLRGKEQRALRTTLAARLTNAQDESALATILPLKVGIEQLRFASKVVGFGAVGDSACAFIDLDPKANAPWRLLPTLAGALWRLPTGAPPLLIELLVPPQVSAFVLRGADLMLPGVLLLRGGTLPHFAEGDLVQIRAVGNPAPFAVGEALVSSTDAIRGGMRGRGVRILHYYGDALWASSGRIVPNAGFSGGERILSMGNPEPLLESEGESVHPVTPPLFDGGEGVGAAVAAVFVAGASKGDKTSGGNGESNSVGGLPLTSVSTPPVLPLTGHAALARWSRASPDELLEATLLQCLTHSRHIAPASLPMLANILFGGAFARAKPVGTDLEPRKTRWKKFSVFLQEQAADGLLRIDGEGGGRLLGWDASHPRLLAWEPWPASAEAGHASNTESAVICSAASPSSAAAASGGTAASVAAAAGALGGGGMPQWAPPVITHVLRAPPALAFVINTVLVARILAPAAFATKAAAAAAAVEGGAGVEIPLSLPGLVLVKRSSKRGGGPSTARNLGTRLVPLGDAFQAKRRQFCDLQRRRACLATVDGSGVGPRGEEEDREDGSEEEGGGGEDEEGVQGGKVCEGGVPTPPSRRDLPHIDSMLTSHLMSCLPSLEDVTILFTHGEAALLFADYVALRKLASDPAAKKNVRLDVALAEVIAGTGGGAHNSRRRDTSHTEHPIASGVDGSVASPEIALTTSHNKHQPMLEATPPGRTGMARIAPLRCGAEEAAGLPSLPRDDVLSRWLSRFTPWHTLIHRSVSGFDGTLQREVSARAGEPPHVRVGHKVVQGKRSLTWVLGCEAFRIDPRTLANDLQRLVAASATLQPAAPLGIRFEASTACEAGAGGEVLAVCVQGEEVERVAAHLVTAWGLPKAVVLAERAKGR